jgi:two-component system, NarL family, nitrate/nitrite response regulator NarL
LLVKDASASTLRAALLQVARSGSYWGADSHSDSAGPITPREYDVLRLVATGHTNVEIGELLSLSNNTVKCSYLRNVMQKLQARDRAQVVTNARKLGLL